MPYLLGSSTVQRPSCQWIPVAAAFKTAQVGASADKNRARMRDRLPLTVLLTLALVAISAPHTAEDF